MKKKILFALTGLCIFVYGFLIFDIPLYPLRAENSNSIDTDNVTEESHIIIRTGASNIALYKPAGALYKTSTGGAGGAMEFFNNNPQVEGEEVLPPGFTSSSRMFRQSQTGNQNHYFYQQTVNGIPVYASQLAVHQTGGNQIYSLQGNVVTDSQVWSGDLTEEEAKTIALTEAKQTTSAPLQVTAVNKVIFNGQSIGVNDDPNNYLTYQVAVEAMESDDSFGRKYFVSTVDGTILFSEDMTRAAKNRKINNCNNSTSCNKSRYEGDPATGIQNIDKAYDSTGLYYDFLKNSFNRDSYNDGGSALIANIDVFAPNLCPNAWSENTSIYLCKELVATDVIVHEFSHSMGHSGPNLVYANQSGAIDEALADIYASGVDGNWTMGEATDDGIERSLEDPPTYGQPDKLFSSRYACGSQDEGGVHTNGGILAKAFYLMVTGGSFNGCTITGIGKEKSFAIIYKAEMSYLTSSSNYKTVYNAIIQACGDLYGGAESADCIQVRNSLRAVQMDQQPEGNQKSPVCNGGQGQQPNCSAPPQNPTATPTPQPTGTAPTVTPGTVPTATPAPTSTPQKVSIHLKLRLQGVFAKPQTPSTIPVKIKLDGARMQTPFTDTVTFSWGEGGILEGIISVEGVSSGEGFALYMKGPLHLERKICDTGPIEIFEGKYACEGRTLTIKSGVNEIDATGILQLAGDIPDDAGTQDDTINSYDLATIRNNYGTQDANMIKRLDLNYDGKVDSRDFDLANLSSSIKLGQ